MGDTTISWTMGDDGVLGKTWNPVRGCSKVSPGCTHCYAERVALRFSGPGQPYEGLADRERGRWTGVVRMVPEHLADPLRWRKPRRIFVNSMSDLFHEKLTNEEIAAVFGVMAAAPQHTFQVLTKRAKRMREWFEWARDASIDEEDPAPDYRNTMAAYGSHRLGDGTDGDAIDQHFHLLDTTAEEGDYRWPLSNVWIGVSVENQEAADERIPELLATPAAVRFLSCEPLIGPVRLHEWLGREHGLKLIGAPPGLRWVISGCESGPGARSCNVSWLRSLRDQCAAAGVAYFLKQSVEQMAALVEDGSHEDRPPFDIGYGDGSKRKAGGVIELPYLDGVQHAAFPEISR
jgi:protein gp37